MTSPYQQRVFEALWPSSAPQWQKVCAVLDSARDPKIFGAVETCRLDKCCLYAGNIPWLLLGTKSVGNDGAFSKVTSIQRVATVGGVAPAGGCAQGAQARVDYSADYYFFSAR